jgi:serine/threonine-protein kinase HipA
VVGRAEGFIQHCIETGYPVGGSSAVQGESPKVLLSEDTRGRFHPSGTLAEDRVKREWLVKFPRGRTDIDRQILKAEATYYDVARRLGCRTGAPLQWEADCLFVPRFDVRPQMDRLQRSGLETMASAMGKTGFGQPAALDEFVTAIRRFSSVPGDDILELFRRDVLNVALGNTDNHSRNTSFLKDEESVRLAPLYDFAPMMVDPEWIARACRWQCREIGGYPCWRDVIGAIAVDSVEKTRFRAEGKRLAAMLPLVPEWLRDAGIGKPILERCEERCCRVMKDLINADQN